MLITQTLCIKQIRKNEALKFLGYDCNKPSRLNSYKKSEWCMPIKVSENPKGDETEGIKITVIQTVKGIKRSKRVSKFRLYCGTYGHQKFFSPPAILEPETISESESSDMYARKAYIINGKTMRIGLNQQIQFPEITHGSITYDEFNVYCTGAKITINGEQHERMLELRTVMITMSEVDVEISPNRIIDLQINVELEKSCIENMKCLMGIDTYLVLEKPNRCQLAKIRSLSARFS